MTNGEVFEEYKQLVTETEKCICELDLEAVFSGGVPREVFPCPTCDETIELGIRDERVDSDAFSMPSDDDSE